ncbi:hypothetical protein KZ451_11000, partial [Glaesserella parasuis]|nr:hypothetical protein [Glaesserella parasuis]
FIRLKKIEFDYLRTMSHYFCKEKLLFFTNVRWTKYAFVNKNVTLINIFYVFQYVVDDKGYQ